MTTVENVTDNIDSVASLIEKIEIDTDNIDISELDHSALDWYAKRFKMFNDDGCKGAITEYLKLLSKSNLNATTCLHIIRLATTYLSN